MATAVLSHISHRIDAAVSATRIASLLGEDLVCPASANTAAWTIVAKLHYTPIDHAGIRALLDRILDLAQHSTKERWRADAATARVGEIELALSLPQDARSAAAMAAEAAVLKQMDADSAARRSVAQS